MDSCGKQTCRSCGRVYIEHMAQQTFFIFFSHRPLPVQIIQEVVGGNRASLNHAGDQWAAEQKREQAKKVPSKHGVGQDVGALSCPWWMSWMFLETVKLKRDEIDIEFRNLTAADCDSSTTIKKRASRLIILWMRVTKSCINSSEKWWSSFTSLLKMSGVACMCTHRIHSMDMSLASSTSMAGTFYSRSIQ